MGPVFLSLLSPANELRNDETSAEEKNGEVDEDFEALGIAKMQPGDGDIPAKRKRCATEQHEDAGKVFRSRLVSPRRWIVGWTHRCAPRVK
jgi:hypothetical protein